MYHSQNELYNAQQQPPSPPLPQTQTQRQNSGYDKDASPAQAEVADVLVTREGGDGNDTNHYDNSSKYTNNDQFYLATGNKGGSADLPPPPGGIVRPSDIIPVVYAPGQNTNYIHTSTTNNTYAYAVRDPGDRFDYDHFYRRKGAFTFDLCTCCERGCGFCCEACWCYYCNLARQCNMCCNNEFGGTACCCSCFWVGLADVICTGALSVLLCCGATACCCYCFWVGLAGVICTGALSVLLCCGGPVSWLTNCCTRSKTRQRFGIEGGCCCDCWAAICCPWCVVQQSLGEFYVQGYNPPTSCCGHSYPSPQYYAQNIV